MRQIRLNRNENVRMILYSKLIGLIIFHLDVQPLKEDELWDGSGSGTTCQHRG